MVESKYAKLSPCMKCDSPAEVYQSGTAHTYYQVEDGMIGELILPMVYKKKFRYVVGCSNPKCGHRAVSNKSLKRAVDMWNLMYWNKEHGIKAIHQKMETTERLMEEHGDPNYIDVNRKKREEAERRANSPTGQRKTTFNPNKHHVSKPGSSGSERMGT